MPEIRTEGVHQEEKIFFSSGATNENIDFQRVGDDHLLEVTHVSVENRTNAYTTVVIGVWDGSNFYELEEEDTVSADDIEWTRSLILVPEGCNLRVRVTGCTSGDEVHATIQGKVTNRKRGKGDG